MSNERPTGGRRRARELAFRTLFQAERGGVPVLEAWMQVREELGETGPGADAEEAYGDALDATGIAFAERLLRAYAERQEEVDARLQEVVEGWTFQQMNQADLNVLRIAVTELLSEAEIPPEVTIEMAVRLAKKFGGEESGRFVNGVLGRLYRSRPPGGEG